MLCCRKRLLLQAARCLHYDKVVVGDTSSDLAARVLSFIAQGRGAQLPHEMVRVYSLHKDKKLRCLSYTVSNLTEVQINNLVGCLKQFDQCRFFTQMDWVISQRLLTHKNSDLILQVLIIIIIRFVKCHTRSYGGILFHVLIRTRIRLIGFIVGV